MGNHRAERVIQRPKGLAAPRRSSRTGERLDIAQGGGASAPPFLFAHRFLQRFRPLRERAAVGSDAARMILSACVRRRMLGRSGVGFPLVLLAAASIALLSGCSTAERLGGTKKEGVRTDSAARYVTPDDPMARPIQVGCPSASASNCGFMFDPVKLKEDFM